MQNTVAYLETSRRSTMDVFCEKMEFFCCSLFLQKSSLVEIQLGSKYVSKIIQRKLERKKVTYLS